MPANSTHPDYDANLTAWLRARDVIAGEDAVKAGGIKYLPRLDSQTDSEYLGYKSRTCFFNATSRTGDGFLGLLRLLFFALGGSISFVSIPVHSWLIDCSHKIRPVLAFQPDFGPIPAVTWNLRMKPPEFTGVLRPA